MYVSLLPYTDMKKKNSTALIFNFQPLAKLITTIVISCLVVLISWVWTPSAIALTQIKLSDLSYQECPAELAQGTVATNSSTSANCFIVTGKAENGTYKTVYDADIYGRIYDANNDPILQNRTRLGSIPEVPPGISDFELRITVPANQPLPLKLKQFKASGFSAQVRK
jgi:hypothetical protein